MNNKQVQFRKRLQKMSTIETIGGAAGASLTLAHSPHPHSSTLVGSLGGILARLRLARRNRKTRIHLIDLTDDQLRDIGITRHEALREIQKSAFL
jgi:uncharacterized protein YjiS (DUF1127 family)